MLKIVIPAVKAGELWDEKTETFIPILPQPEKTLILEHSLLSISKWESKWCKPYFSKQEKTNEESIDYIRCMTITKNVNPDVYDRLTKENIDEISAYIEAPMTATHVSKNKNGKRNRQIVTSELIYYWMITLSIPIEFQKWHINRLITLIDVCNAENAPSKKRSGRELAKEYAAINAANRKRFNSKG